MFSNMANDVNFSGPIEFSKNFDKNLQNNSDFEIFLEMNNEKAQLVARPRTLPTTGRDSTDKKIKELVTSNVKGQVLEALKAKKDNLENRRVGFFRRLFRRLTFFNRRMRPVLSQVKLAIHTLKFYDSINEIGRINTDVKKFIPESRLNSIVVANQIIDLIIKFTERVDLKNENEASRKEAISYIKNIFSETRDVLNKADTYQRELDEILNSIIDDNDTNSEKIAKSFLDFKRHINSPSL